VHSPASSPIIPFVGLRVIPFHRFGLCWVGPVSAADIVDPLTAAQVTTADQDGAIAATAIVESWLATVGADVVHTSTGQRKITARRVPPCPRKKQRTKRNQPPSEQSENGAR
jgi:hypothetical protein